MVYVCPQRQALLLKPPHYFIPHKCRNNLLFSVEVSVQRMSTVSHYTNPTKRSSKSPAVRNQRSEQGVGCSFVWNLLSNARLWMSVPPTTEKKTTRAPLLEINEANDDRARASFTKKRRPPCWPGRPSVRGCGVATRPRRPPRAAGRRPSARAVRSRPRAARGRPAGWRRG